VRERAARLGSVRVTGDLTDAESAKALDEHDVFVLPSRYEGFGIAIAEALAHGLAVVASRAGAIPEDGRGAGLLVDPDDVADLARALRTTVAGADPRARLPRAALARAKGLPTWNATREGFARALFERAA